MMADPSFVRHPSFPEFRARVTQGTKTKKPRLWKLEVREWAFASVDATDVDPGLTPTSNNPNPVFDHWVRRPGRIKGTPKPGTRDMTVRFYARAPGFTIIHLFDKDFFKAAFDGIQVEVLLRQASLGSGISLARLSGKTCAINAHDADAYEMDTTLTFNRRETDMNKIFSAVPGDLDHLVISSHAGAVGGPDPAAMGLFLFAVQERVCLTWTEQMCSKLLRL